MNAISTRVDIPSLKGRVATAEWQARVELAACYRLVAHQGWTDGMGTHIAARVPDEDGHFLLNPVGLFFHEVTASSLIKVDFDGRILTETDFRLNSGGLAIHGAVFMARPDINASIHTHTEAGMAISVLDCRLLSITPVSLRFHKRIGYHDYFGQAGEFDDRDLIGKDLGGNNALIMKNHGLLTVGETMGDAFVDMCALEAALKAQLRAMSTGYKIVVPPEEVCDRAAGNRARKNSRTNAEDWKAWLRVAASLDPSYRD